MSRITQLPFLDTFTLFNKAVPVDVVIFSSAEKMSENDDNGDDNERKALEYRRTRLVCDHLEPHYATLPKRLIFSHVPVFVAPLSRYLSSPAA